MRIEHSRRPRWRIIGTPFPYTGAGSGKPTVERGYRFDLRDDDGRSAFVEVERASGADVPLTAHGAARLVSTHLDDAAPPTRIAVGPGAPTGLGATRADDVYTARDRGTSVSSS